MVKSLFTSSFKTLPKGFVFCAIFVLCLEMFLFSKSYFISDMSTLSVVRTSKLIEAGQSDDIIVLGSSRSLALDAKILESLTFDDDSAVNLSVPSLGTSLQYNMQLQKYLADNEKPEYILFAVAPEIFGQFGVDQLFYTLWSGEADRFRRFFSLFETLNYISYKEKVFLIGMYAKNILNSYNYRVYIKDFVNFSVFGTSELGSEDVVSKNHKLIEKMKATNGQMIYWPDRQVPYEEQLLHNILPLGAMADYEYDTFYLHKDKNISDLLTFALINDIPVLMYTMPVSTPRYELMKKYGNFRYMERRVQEWEETYPNFRFYNYDFSYPMKLFGDSSHLNMEGAERFNREFLPGIAGLINRGKGDGSLPEGGISVDIGNELDEEGAALIGFYKAEKNDQGDTWRWSGGDNSRFSFYWLPQRQKTKYRLSFKIEPFVGQRGREITISTAIDSVSVVVEPGLKEYQVDLIFPISSHLTFNVNYDNAISPKDLGAGSDGRKIAVRWSEMNLQYPPPFSD